MAWASCHVMLASLLGRCFTEVHPCPVGHSGVDSHNGAGPERTQESASSVFSSSVWYKVVQRRGSNRGETGRCPRDWANELGRPSTVISASIYRVDMPHGKTSSGQG